MTNALIACCGLDCEKCEARIATLKNDDALREKTARKWREMNQAPQITADTINCLGCRTAGVKFAYCNLCQIRQCAAEKGLDTCGGCEESDACSTLAPVLAHAPQAKANLRAARGGKTPPEPAKED